eukprot:CAMPEP_0176501424 /NCGR_PEP_ID=MMETSP0200_2-20121128/14153_1 /TAXON_ID=947934 /ORGANISM="Chaetoceros sp., Strain GSL56" /LENGTH=980 /DNA_ID=CAMNT_0017900309 /DNA_START=328 /DNA_END=3267 /DNA_ORIENTATION=+
MLPFAPLLLGHLMRKSHEDVAFPLPESMWPSVAWATAGMIATYMVGRSIGTAIGEHSKITRTFYQNTKTRAFTRTAGIVLALHLFCFGAGLNGAVWLYFMRFFMGVLIGIIMRVSSYTGNRQGQGFDENSLENIVEAGTAKVWLMGFAVSMLTSGVLYYPLCHSAVFTALAGGDSSSWSWLIGPVVFVTIVYLADIVLNCLCGRFILVQNDVDERQRVQYDLDSSQKTNFKDENIVESAHGSSAVKRRVRLGSSGHRAKLSSSPRSRLGSHNGGNRNRIDSLNRSRLDSSMSNDVFFDCESHCTSGSITWGLNENCNAGSPLRFSASHEVNDHFYSTAIYENGKCVYEDGSPAPVQSGLCAAHVPPAWNLIHKTRAGEMWEATKRWRIENKTWKIHSIPHSLFPKIKDGYQHYLHGYSKMGYPVVYEKPGSMTLKNYFADGSITVDDMLHHYTYFMEFISNSLCSRPEVRERLDKRPENESACHWGFMVVMDVSGLSLGILSGDVLRYLQQAGRINSSHYPSSTRMALLVNSPFWLSGAFGNIKFLLPENTQADILSSSSQLEGMRKYIDDDQIPKEFGGSSPYALGKHPFEKELQRIVNQGMNNKDSEVEDEQFLYDGLYNNGNDIQESISFDIPDHVHKVGFEEESNDRYKDVELGNLQMLPLMSACDLDVDYSSPFDDKVASSCRYVLSLRNGHRWKNSKYYAEEYIFMMISIIHFIWCAAQGSLETIIPIWLLSPQVLGGLGYDPRRSAFALFTASIVVMWLLRSKVAKCVGSIPTNSPMRGYRIGVGSEAVILMIVPFVPFISNFDSMLVLTTNALCCASIFIASIIGRMSCAKLHVIASSAYVEKISLRCDTRTGIGQCLNMIADFVQKGGLSYILGVTGELIGSLIVTPIIVWSSQAEHPFPLNASFSFYTGATLCILLYMSSFSFRVAGETSYRRTLDERLHHVAPMSCSILRDVIAVSSQDMASMFEEQNW